MVGKLVDTIVLEKPSIQDTVYAEREHTASVVARNNVNAALKWIVSISRKRKNSEISITLCVRSRGGS
jgi:hypothetical protein